MSTQSTPIQQPKVEIGPSTLLGAGGGIVAFVVAVIAFIQGDRTEETITAIVTGALLIGGVIMSRTRQQNVLTQTAGRLLNKAPTISRGLVAGEPINAGVPVRAEVNTDTVRSAVESVYQKEFTTADPQPGEFDREPEDDGTIPEEVRPPVASEVPEHERFDIHDADEALARAGA